VAQTGDVIENTITGHRVKFLQTMGDTNGELLQLEYTLLPGGYASPWHIHLDQAERFEVVTGRLGVRLDKHDNLSVLEVGQEVTIPPPQPHQFENASADEPVTFIFDIRPAGRFEVWLESYFALAQQGKVGKSGLPRNVLQTAVLLNIADTYLVTPKLLAYVQKGLIAVVAFFGRLFGYRERIASV
jgi:mannose-6-phosphate isomerase-like protein (cupin superfamily)